MTSNMAVALAPFGRWTLRDEAVRSMGHILYCNISNIGQREYSKCLA
jgi:hypothetical protein